MNEKTTSVIVAVKGNSRNIDRIIGELAPAELGSGVELVFACAGTPPEAIANLPHDTKVLETASDVLVPHLWRDGIRAATARRIALITSECIPAHDWLDYVVASDVERWAGIGGLLVNDHSSDALNWAVYLLRYVRFAPPMDGGRVDDIAADNAVYDRNAILACPDLLEAGFWEPSFHARFHESGRELLLDPRMRVTFSGTNELGAFIRHRYAHGREYGQARGIRSAGFKRIVLLAATLILPGLILARIFVRASRRRLAGQAVRSLPWLVLFVLAWVAGESRGYAASLLASAKRERA